MSKEKLEFVEPVDTNTDNEYSREPVPLAARKSCFSLHNRMDWICFSCN